jgi:dihydrolipoamide dehydrogenase
MQTFDLVVVGAGPGGYVAAIRAAQLGLQVALVEKDERLGGTCLNVGCIPSKALLESSELYAQARTHFAGHGLRVGDLGFDLEALHARRLRIVQELTDGIRLLMKKNKVTVIQGTGRLVAPDRVAVDGPRPDELAAPRVLLAAGSAPVQLPFLPFDGQVIVTSTEALAFDRVPGHLVVVGAGAVGLELGSVWSRLGAKVTVVEMMDQIVPAADHQLAKLLLKALKGQGMEFRLKTSVTGAEVKDGQATLALKDDKGATEALVADRVLVAVGRRPFPDALGLDAVGVALDERRRVKVNERFETSVPGVYAIGDLIAGPMLAHKASEEGVAVAELLAGKPGHVSYDAVPAIVYTAPELASVGLTEDEAEKRKVAVKVGKFYFKANGRAKALGDEDGLVKVVADAETDRLLGVHILGPRASELIAEAAVALELHASAEDLGRAVHAHPTLAEAIKEAALAVDRRAIHG